MYQAESSAAHAVYNMYVCVSPRGALSIYFHSCILAGYHHKEYSLFAQIFISNIFLILLLNLSVLTTSLSTTTTRSKREVPGSIPGTHYRNFIISKSSQICSFGGLWLRLVNVQMVRRTAKRLSFPVRYYIAT